MIDQNKHIVSKVIWDTSFDEKDLAASLQTEISRWGKLKLESEINNVFDQFCSSEQHWKIDSLELDLGQIDFSDLHGELSRKFSKQLVEQLREQLFQIHNKKDGVKVVDKKASNLSILKSYLSKGYMPWWADSASGGAQQLMIDLLKHNRSSLIKVLRVIGQSDKVRKRLAWQFNDDSLTQIVAGLEPNNHKQIIDFKDNLATVQSKEKIVESSSSEFSNEAWLWILSCLLVQRGTLFNNVIFMKSMLYQMSARYNIKFNELIILIEKAFESVALRSNVQSGFIAKLAIISNESIAEREKNTKPSPTNYWNLLENYFSKQTEATSEIAVSEVNDIIVSLAQNSKTQFVEWIIKFKNNPNQWASLLHEINEQTYAAILFSIAPIQSDVLITNVQLISKALVSNKIKVDRIDLWNLSLNYLIDNKHSRINSKSYVQNLIEILAKRKGLTKIELTSRLADLNNWPTVLTKPNIDLFEGVTALLKDQTGENPNVVTERITQLLSRLNQDEPSDASQSAKVYELLVRWIQTNPIEAFAALLDYKNKESLHKFLSAYLDNYHALLIIKELKTDQAIILNAIQEVMKSLQASKELEKAFVEINANLMVTGLLVMLENSKLKGIKFILEVLTRSSNFLSKQSRIALYKIVNPLLAHKNLSSFSFSKTEISEFEKELFRIKEQSLLIRTHVLISNSESDLTATGKFLISNFDDREFKLARDLGAIDLKIILNNFLEEGAKVKPALLTAALRKISTGKSTTEKARIASELSDLFWKCILQYNEYSGNLEKFKTVFDRAIAFNYNRTPSIIKSKPSIKGRGVHLKSGESLALSEILAILSKGIKSALLVIVQGNVSYDIVECLRLALEVDAAEVQKVLAKTEMNQKRIKHLSELILFSRFCKLISTEMGLKLFFDAMYSLNEIALKVGNNQIGKNMLDEFWKLTWQTIQATRMDANAFNQLVKKTIFEIAKELDVKASYVLDEIKSNNIPIGSTLKNAMIKTHEVFEIIPDPVKPKFVVKDLEKCIKMGLLEELAKSMLLEKQIPSWFLGTKSCAYETILNEIIEHNPLVFLKIYRHQVSIQEHKMWVGKRVELYVLVKSIQAVNPNLASKLNALLEMHKAFGQLTMGSLSGKQLQYILKDKILAAWSANNWNFLSAENIWNELMWEICTKRGVSSEQFLLTMQEQIDLLPSAMQVSLNQLLSKRKVSTPAIIDDEEIEEKPKFEEEPKIIKEGIAVKNAGVVLLADYIKMLFDKLGLLSNDDFSDKKNQLKAIHYLQYVITGASSTDESLLPLNKVICGLHPGAPITAGIEITTEETELISGLINAVIGYWSAIGDTSIDGFRGNWLVRAGTLVEHEDNWELTVDKKPYDLLINKSPFAFSIIKYPWMKKALHVTWPY
ncbi:MAG: hypothetical protein HRT71_00285 [Flavobacteriales bacterium]|nr:hypothetical protein [Flavobacteriales bacterium]